MSLNNHESKSSYSRMQPMSLDCDTSTIMAYFKFKLPSSSSRILPHGLFRLRNLIFSEFINLWAFGRAPWTGDQTDLRRTTQHRETRTQIHAPSGVRTRDPSVRATEDSTRLRPRGHGHRQI